LSDMDNSSKHINENEILILKAELEKEKQKIKDIQKYCKSLETKFDLSKKMLHQKDILITELEKLSGVGQYVPEIIHKLKNPLMGISGYTELAEIADSRDDMLIQLEKIHPQITRLSTLLGQFRNMVTYSPNEFIKVDMTLNVTEALQVLELFKPKIFEIKNHFSDEDVNISGDPDQLHQLHYNLAKIIFKSLPHDQNRLIEIYVRNITKKECLKMKSDIFIHALSEKRWLRMLEKFEGFNLVQYKSDMLELSGTDLKEIFVENFENTNIGPPSILLSFKIILDIVKRHYGNLIVNDQDSKTFFNLILPAY